MRIESLLILLPALAQAAGCSQGDDARTGLATTRHSNPTGAASGAAALSNTQGENATLPVVKPGTVVIATTAATATTLPTSSPPKTDKVNAPGPATPLVIDPSDFEFSCECPEQRTGITLWLAGVRAIDAGATDAGLSSGPTDALPVSALVAMASSSGLELNARHPQPRRATQCEDTHVRGSTASRCGQWGVTLDACLGPDGQLPCIRVSATSVILTDVDGTEYSGRVTEGVSQYDAERGNALSGSLTATLLNTTQDSLALEADFTLCDGDAPALDFICR